MALTACSLATEQQLEDMVVAAPEILSNEWMLIGRRESTGLGGRIDLLAIAPDASLVVIELKRDPTRRDARRAKITIATPRSLPAELV